MLTPTAAVASVFRKYADFTGRAPRSEYWWWGLFVWVLVGIFLPNLAVLVRRLHDANFSGWYVLLAFIPIVGGLIVLVLTLLPGNPTGARFDSIHTRGLNAPTWQSAQRLS